MIHENGHRDSILLQVVERHRIEEVEVSVPAGPAHAVLQELKRIPRIAEVLPDVAT